MMSRAATSASKAGSAGSSSAGKIEPGINKTRKDGDLGLLTESVYRARVRDDFDSIAQLGPDSETADRFERMILARMPERCDAALDVGCGKGRLTRLLASRAGRVVGVDFAPRMIGDARCLSEGCENVDFVTADVGEWPFP